MQNKNLIVLIIAVVFVLGAGTIVYYGRPIMKLSESSESQVVNNTITEEDESEESDETEANKNEEATNSTVTAAETETEATQDTTSGTTTTTTQAAGTYTTTQVASHATESDCWSSVGGSVYDLTSWIARHPGGSKAIIGLCGIDATSKFEKVHGGSSAAKAALALLKIGALAQ